MEFRQFIVYRGMRACIARLLYEFPRGYQVDGLPRVASLGLGAFSDLTKIVIFGPDPDPDSLCTNRKISFRYIPFVLYILTDYEH